MKIPIFPLNGAILFPRTNLPLNIFEERYIDMINYSLSNNRLVGMVQHKENNDLYSVGCCGKITVFNETPDKRYLINLEGMSCFKIIREFNTEYKFRVCEIEKINNFNKNNLQEGLKPKILDSFKKYNQFKKINVSLDDISELNIDDLLKLIVMISPFEDNVKQMFLELKSNEELYDSVLSTLKIELASKQESNTIN
jgi:hypothetical protein